MEQLLKKLGINENLSPEEILGELEKKQMELLDRFVSAVPFYRMTCNMEPEAALVACRGIFGEKN